jgi:hypothetical protein
MARIRFGKLSSSKQPEVRPYALAVGQVAFAWNDLHEELAMLFIAVMGSIVHKKALATWNAVEFDRPKRKMLLAAIAQSTEEEIKARPELIEDTKWLLAQAEALEDTRNDCVHSPLFATGYLAKLLIAAAMEGVRFLPVVPQTNLGNRRALKLAERSNLLAEMRWCRDQAEALSRYTSALARAVATPTFHGQKDRDCQFARRKRTPQPRATNFPQNSLFARLDHRGGNLNLLFTRTLACHAGHDCYLLRFGTSTV